MNATKVVIVIVIIIAIAGAAFIFTRPQTTESPVNTETDQESMQEQINDEPIGNDEDEMMESDEDEMGMGETIEITGRNYEFSQEVIEVEVGEPVTIEFTSNQGMHDWVIDQFDARTEMVNQGETTSVTFTPTETGEFEYYCSVGNHRELGMVGTLVVTE